jgi:thioredoxin reductase (NADPH)
MKVDPVAVIGAGPAGLAAAMQLARMGISARLLERADPGGLLLNAHWVENYPGFPDGLSGPDLARLMRRQAESFGALLTKDEIVSIVDERKVFRIKGRARNYLARRIVLASGTKARRPDGCEIPPEMEGRVHTEVVALREASGLRVAVVGAGDAAFDYAIGLSERNDVTLLKRGAEDRCLPLLRKRAAKNACIDIRDHVNVLRLAPAPSGGASVCGTWKGSNFRLDVDAVIFAVGRDPETGCLSRELLENIPALCASGRLFPAGDVQNGLCRQASIAAGDGMRAAMEIHRLMKEGGE